MAENETKIVENLKGVLMREGFEFEVTAEGDTYTVSINVPIPPQELPEELVPFAWSADEVERAMWKGNTTKKTYNGAEFELALKGYAYEQFSALPEVKAHEATLESVTNMQELNAYEKKRKRLWKQFISTHPKISVWDAWLDSLY